MVELSITKGYKNRRLCNSWRETETWTCLSILFQPFCLSVCLSGMSLLVVMIFCQLASLSFIIPASMHDALPVSFSLALLSLYSSVCIPLSRHRRPRVYVYVCISGLGYYWVLLFINLIDPRVERQAYIVIRNIAGKHTHPILCWSRNCSPNYGTSFG